MQFTDLPDEIIDKIGRMSITGSVVFRLLKIGYYREPETKYHGLKIPISHCLKMCRHTSFVIWLFERFPPHRYSYSDDIVDLFYPYLVHISKPELVKYIPQFYDNNRISLDRIGNSLMGACCLKGSSPAVEILMEQVRLNIRIGLLQKHIDLQNILRQGIHACGYAGDTDRYTRFCAWCDNLSPNIYIPVNYWSLGLVAGGHLELLQKSIADSGPPDATTHPKMLEDASKYDRLDIVNWLLDKFSFDDVMVRTALLGACRAGHSTIVERLLMCISPTDSDKEWCIEFFRSSVASNNYTLYMKILRVFPELAKEYHIQDIYNLATEMGSMNVMNSTSRIAKIHDQTIDVRPAFIKACLGSKLNVMAFLYYGGGIDVKTLTMAFDVGVLQNKYCITHLYRLGATPNLLQLYDKVNDKVKQDPTQQNKIYRRWLKSRLVKWGCDLVGVKSSQSPSS